MPTPPAPTLRALLARPDLQLTLAGDESRLVEGALDAPLRWVHSSDLPDPTAFLVDGLVLLTTGTQFADAEDDAAAAEYVERLQAHGVRGLGFGTEVVRAGIPPALLRTCEAVGMPLFEVPYRTPFIAVARANAEAIAAQAYSRRSWALDAQRAISRAALRPDGLRATVTELARQLDQWVGLFDGAGALVQQHPAASLPAGALDELQVDVQRLLQRGHGSGSRVAVGGVPFSLQTLGSGGRLSGVIAIAGETPATEARDLVTAVTALAELALAHNVVLGGARDALREALVSMLLAGHTDVVVRVAGQAWGPLPAGEVVIAWATVQPERTAALSDWLAVRAADDAVFFGRIDDGMLVVSTDAELPDRIANEFDATVGIAPRHPLSAARTAYRQARTAHARARSGEAARFADLADQGMLAALHTDDAQALAQRLLQPVREHDRAQGTALEQTLRAWLAHDAQLDAAARTLGVHRHTVRARVQQAQELLGLDLASFPARAQLWAAFASLG